MAMSERRRLRHERIIATLRSGASLRVADLARALGVSTETIRRDLDALKGEGRLERTYGGATRRIEAEPGLAVRRDLYVPERERIARAATTLIADGQMLMIGSGATTLHVARDLAARRRSLTVLTHSHGVAAALSVNPTIEVIVAPGTFMAGEAAVTGAHSLAFLQKFSADVAILGASGLTADGAEEALIASGAVYALMAERSGVTMVVADHSKMNRASRMRYREWGSIDYLVTDASPAGDTAAAIERAATRVMIASA
jgi:DeoR/GlpR family transcriptional regulator of sugar metabolism